MNLLSTMDAAFAAISGGITGFYGVSLVESPEQEIEIFKLRITMESLP